ncbi:hypothetical protein EPA93_39470 [Ktedonosporobacter rubrisoli]|uniref:HAMP domain-containing protein n=1 Tax=Ktedonosporobacter rubrisoli TaxID=2509675 RepID=A0A4P6K0Y7_KTERU|nr:hypothetical protein [Ktedonosporobacter rubrisoli]QBD81729.1 hypothetical protein EPA93_39470 [Ktedonosporobacter rubrisoli]
MSAKSSPSLSNQQDNTEWSLQYINRADATPGMKILNWWYRFTAPPTLPDSASFEQRERLRRGYLASTISFFLTVVLVFALPIGIFGPNHAIAFAITGVLIMMGIALFIFNRRGHSNVTGLILASCINIALIIVILKSPEGLDPSELGLFDILVFPEIFVASLLPVNWIFAVSAFNIAFIIVDMFTQPRSQLFIQMATTNFYPVLVRPIILHIVITVVLWLWVRNATQAIERADRAEVIANLEHMIADQEHAVAEEKRQLDSSIQQIMDTHLRVSHGDFSARVPLREGATLWPVAVSLNNLLSRLQRLRQIETELQRVIPQLQRVRFLEHETQRIKHEAQQITQAIEQAEQEQHPLRLGPRGTILDPLITKLNGKLLLPGSSRLENGPTRFNKSLSDSQM